MCIVPLPYPFPESAPISAGRRADGGCPLSDLTIAVYLFKAAGGPGVTAFLGAGRPLSNSGTFGNSYGGTGV